MRLNNGWIAMVELLIEGAHEHDHQTGERSTERNFGVRIRNDFPLAEDARFVLRGLLGYAWQGEERYAHYYVEPSFRYSVGPVEMMVGYRLAYGIDTGREHDLNKFRWARSWNLHSGQHVSDAYIVEYTQKF